MKALSKKEKRLQRQPETVVIAPPSRLRAAARLASSPLISYAAILLLQLRVMWGIWWYKDFTGGDTSSYFLGAWRWAHDGRDSLLWSPLYTTFYSWFLHVSSDAYVVTILHRMAIDLLLAALLLALMRRLLSPGIAWMAAAWWVVLPVNFNSLYEVHLFTVIPLLLAAMAPAWMPGPWGRGISVAIFLATFALVRQEYLAAMLAMAVLGFGWDALQAAKGRLGFRTLSAAYAVPLVAAGALIGFYYEHNDYKSVKSIAAELRHKNSFNMCQIFASGYQQRHPEFQTNPMTTCEPLMTELFGSPQVTIVDAMVKNPRAMLEHIEWNLEETPAGLQLALFNLRWGGITPDFIESFHSPLVWIPTAIVAGFAGFGLWLIFRGDALASRRIWTWIALLCGSAASVSVILTAYARPATLFILAIAIRALTGLGFQALLDRWPRLTAWSVAGSVLLTGAVLAVPSLYERVPSPRVLLRSYRRLLPAKDLFGAPGETLVASDFETELNIYIGHCVCRAFRFDQLRPETAEGRPFGEVLNEHQATLFLADEKTIGDPAVQRFLADPGAFHWSVVNQGHASGENWALLRKNQ